jgi:hypothetical protein
MVHSVNTAAMMKDYYENLYHSAEIKARKSETPCSRAAGYSATF